MSLSVNSKNDFGLAALAITQSVQQSLFNQKKYEQITSCEIDDLLEKIDTFVREALPKYPLEERLTLEQDLALPRYMLLSCREMIHKFESHRLTQALIQKSRRFSLLNLAYDGKFNLRCPAVGMSRLPWTGYYGKRNDYTQQTHLFLMRIHPLFLTQVPVSVANVIKDKMHLTCDFIFNASYAVHMEKESRAEGLYPRYNLVTHPWVLSRAQEGQESKKFPSIGIFEPLGITHVHGNDGASFGSLNPMEVYIHPTDSGMAISPNNAHFNVVEGIPFSAFWHVTICDERILVANQWLINDASHPFSILIKKSLTDETSQCIKDHLHILKSEKMMAIQEATDRLEKVAMAFENSHSDAFILFKKLSLGEQSRVFYLTWVLMGEKRGVHNDFGQASFKATPDLKTEYHCSSLQRAQVIRTLLQDQVTAFEKLLQGQEALFTAPKEYPHLSPERMRKEKVLKPIMERLKAGDVPEAMMQFTGLPESDRRKIFEMTWDLKDCPMGIHSDFGRASFLRSEEINPKYHCSDTDRLDALILYLNQ